MAVLAFAALLLLAMAGQSSANWCVCKEGLGDAVWQKTLDYACGAGADCNPIHSNGGCYNPNTVKAHCNYAVNSYFQKGQAQGSCDFAGTANPVTSDPSVTGCVYPSSASTAGTTTTPVTNTPGTPSTGTGTGTPSTGTGTGTGTTTPTTSTTPTTGTTTPTTTNPHTATLGWSSVHFTKDAANNWDPMLFTKSTAGTTTTPVTNTPGTPATGTGTPSTGTGTGTPSTGTSTGTPSTGTGTGTTTPTTSTTPTTGTTTPTTTTPYTATPGVLGGIGTGVGPSGAGINSDDSGVIRLVDASLFSSILTLFVSGLMLWWG